VSVGYALSSGADVQLTIEREAVSHRCTGRARVCVHYVPLIKATLGGHAAQNSALLALAHALPGGYRLIVQTLGRSGPGVARYVHFTIR
jgi:hypothetical protein